MAALVVISIVVAGVLLAVIVAGIALEVVTFVREWRSVRAFAAQDQEPLGELLDFSDVDWSGLHRTRVPFDQEHAA